MRDAPEVKKKIRHYKLISKVVKYLAETGPQNTTAICGHVNTTTRHGTTMNELGNVLAKCGYFRKAGVDEQLSIGSGHYKIIVWDIIEAESDE